MHFSPPTKADSSASPSPKAKANTKANEPSEKEDSDSKREEEEEITEWREGRDIVLERQPRVPGEDVQVEVLHGAAAAAAASDESEGGRVWGDVKEKCREVKREVGKVVNGHGHG